MSETTPCNENRFLYPVALDVTGRLCVVVGGGIVGARKAVALAEAGASVTIVSPELCTDARILVSDQRARHIAEPFAPAHLNGAFLVVAATDRSSVNSAVAQTARAQGVLINMAAPGEDISSDSGDFATMATVRRGDLLLAATTGGAGPALTARIKGVLADKFGEEWGATVSLFAELRIVAKTMFPDPQSRTEALRRVSGRAGHIANLYKNGDAEAARKEAYACLQS